MVASTKIAYNMPHSKTLHSELPEEEFAIVVN